MSSVTVHHSEHETLTRSCFNVGVPSATKLGQRIVFTGMALLVNDVTILTEHINFGVVTVCCVNVESTLWAFGYINKTSHFAW